MAASMRTLALTRASLILPKFSEKLWHSKPLQIYKLLEDKRHYRIFQCHLSTTCRLCSDSRELTVVKVKKMMESLTDKFTEARELLEDARESRGTVYFSDDMREAQQAVEDTLAAYKEFLKKLSDKQRRDVVASLGLRMEELKAQMAAIEDELKHDD